LWRDVEHVPNGSARRWMLALTALAAFGATVGQEWHGRPFAGISSLSRTPGVAQLSSFFLFDARR
jgi:hypothetical protein